MTKTISSYLASRPVVTDPTGATDKTLILQGGVIKMIDPQLTAVLLDAGGSGRRFQVTITVTDTADDGVTPILAVNGVEV